MKTATRTKRPDPTKIYICWNAFSVDVDGIPQTYPMGYRLRGDHPAVARWMENFYEDGAPTGEIPDARALGTHAALEAEASRRSRDSGGVTVLEPLVGPDVVAVAADFAMGDRMFSRGQRFRKNDPEMKKTIREHPEFFVPANA